jgi:hypothetical protein
VLLKKDFKVGTCCKANAAAASAVDTPSVHLLGSAQLCVNKPTIACHLKIGHYCTSLIATCTSTVQAHIESGSMPKGLCQQLVLTCSF